MPVGTKVDRVFQALKREGKDVATAAKIAQAQTGLALATGKPPKHKRGNAMRGKRDNAMRLDNSELYQS